MKESITSIHIDFDKDILRINGKDITDRPIIVTVPSKGGQEDGWKDAKAFNLQLASGRQEEYDRWDITYTKGSYRKESEACQRKQNIHQKRQ